MEHNNLTAIMKLHFPVCVGKLMAILKPRNPNYGNNITAARWNFIEMCHKKMGIYQGLLLAWLITKTTTTTEVKIVHQPDPTKKKLVEG
jgi:hypothetical protein